MGVGSVVSCILEGHSATQESAYALGAEILVFMASCCHP